MHLEREWVEELIYGSETARRFTQDSPILPDVWIGYGTHPDEPMDVLMTPFGEVRAGELACCLRERLSKDHRPDESEVAYNRSTVAARLPFDLICALVLPISDWWHRYITKPNQAAEKAGKEPIDPADELDRLAEQAGGSLNSLMQRPQDLPKTSLSYEVLWMALTLGALLRGLQTKLSEEAEASLEQRKETWKAIVNTPEESLREMAAWFRKVATWCPASDAPLVYSVNRNRTLELSIHRSCQTMKADAASRVFAAGCAELTWAIVDTGIDATHPAFRIRDQETGCTPDGKAFEQSAAGKWINHTRIKATYDFSAIRSILSADGNGQLPEQLEQRASADPRLREQLRQLSDCLRSGREVDWSLLEPLLAIPHTDDYVVPGLEHGTHVAGILGADWPSERRDGQPYRGVCPDINLLDIRVMDSKGNGDEFTVIAALQYLRWLNVHKDFQVVHGVNLSLSIPHDVANYACGRTPICEECERLVSSGVVVVAAAGNKGYLRYMTPTGLEDGYRSISITDPGNAQGVITVGSTHRTAPHSYGVSYFSSRGPTGDGRHKPDMVAPGEKIEGPVPKGGSKVLDGTSMAAPHVCGAAALLMARNRELRGDPTRIKQILCATATDLGRERYFQGCGLVDVLRALQSV